MKHLFGFWVVTFLTLFQLNAGHAAEKAKNPSGLFTHKQLITGLNISQINYENWVAGGEDALSWVASIDAKFEIKHKKMRYHFATNMEYGQVKQDKEPPKVAQNKLNVETVITYLKGSFVNPFFSVKLNSPITRSYDYSKTPKQPKADFLDPLVLQQSMGMGFNPIKELKTRFGIALKETRTHQFTFYSDDPKTPEVERLKVETGIDHTTEFNKTFNENLKLYSKLELFSSFEHLDVVDVRWRNTLQAKLTKMIAVNVKAHYLYDKDVSLKGQFMHSITIGLTYNFF